MSARAFLIFSGANPRAIVAFCREMERLGQAVNIIARTPQDFIFKTKYRRYVLATRRLDALDSDDLRRCIIESRQKSGVSRFIICPTSEYFNAFALNHLSFFAELDCEVALVNQAIYQTVSNKSSCSALCQKNGIDIPQRVAMTHVAPPIVAKPLMNINAQGKSLYPHLIDDEEKLAQFHANENLTDFYFEEYITGPSFYLLFYLARDGKVHKFSQKNIAQQANGKSMVMAQSDDLHETAVADQFATMLQAIGFHGLVMIDLMKQRETGRFVFIEMNPRFWGPSQLMVDAHSDILAAFIGDYLFEDSARFARSAPQKARYLWLGGCLANAAHGESLKWHIVRPRWTAVFILRRLFNDVYLRRDTLRFFGHVLYLAGRDLLWKRKNE